MILQLALGILTAIGGFIDVGSIATAALAGACATPLADVSAGWKSSAHGVRVSTGW